MKQRSRNEILLIQVGENEAIVTFGEMGFQETSLVSPFDSTRVLFSIPPNWRLVPTGEVQLEYEVTLTGADLGLIGTEQNPYGGSLVVTFNDKLVSTIAIEGIGSADIDTLPAARIIDAGAPGWTSPTHHIAQRPVQLSL